MFDFVDLVAAPFPLMVIAELLGIPDGDRPDFRRWSDATIEATDKPPEETADATGEMFMYLMEHIEAKKANPVTTSCRSSSARRSTVVRSTATSC